MAVGAFSEGIDVLVHTAYRSDADSLRPVVVEGSRHVAAAAARQGVRLIHVSTDAVFSGRSEPPYTEADQTEPITPYGVAKAEAEAVVTTTCPDAVLVRPSLMWSSDHTDHQSSMVRSALSGDQLVRFFTDEHRHPVRTEDVALAIEALLRNPLSGPLHVAGQDRVSRYELAQLLARSMGLGSEELIGATQPSSGPPRPKDVPFDSSRAEKALQITLPGVLHLLGD